MEGEVAEVIKFTGRSVTLRLTASWQPCCVLKPQQLIRTALENTVWEGSRKNPFPILIGAKVKLVLSDAQPKRGPPWYELEDIKYKSKISDVWLTPPLQKDARKVADTIERNIAFRKTLMRDANVCGLRVDQNLIVAIGDVITKHGIDYNVFKKNPLKTIKKYVNVDVPTSKWKFLEDLSKYYGVDQQDIDAEWVDSLIYEAERNNGHMYLPMTGLVLAVQRAAQLSNRDVVHTCNSSDMFVVSNNIVYRKEDYDVEMQTATMLTDVLFGDDDLDDIHVDWDSSLQDEQLRICTQVVESDAKITCVAGYPGVGKSFVVGHVCNAWNRHRSGNVLVLAPTGKASDRLRKELRKWQSATEEDVAGRIRVSTIHRALVTKSKWNDDGDECNHVSDGDLIVVDEMSMVDAHLFHRLLRECRVDAKLLLLGDPDQLPSIDRGDVFKQLLACPKIPVVRLTKRYRSVGDILQLSDSIRLGNSSIFGKQSESIQYVEAQHPDDILRIVSQIRKKHVDTENTIQVLVPTNTGSCGTLRINYMIHEEQFGERSPIYDRPSATKWHDSTPPPLVTDAMIRRQLCIADRVVVTKNDSESKYFNGQMGFVDSSEDDSDLVKILLDGNTTATEIPRELVTMGYAVTVHKAQGSEYDAVILVIHPSHGRNLTRPILYTAVTRAKSKLYIVGSRVAFEQAVNTVHPRRNSRLAAMLNESS